MDRKIDIVISGEENISTVEVENVIYRHPAVMEVAVIPVPAHPLQPSVSRFADSSHVQHSSVDA